MKTVPLFKKYPHVAVCVDKTRCYCRGVLAGIADYVETYGPWVMYVGSQVDGGYSPEWLQGWQGNGVLVCVPDPVSAVKDITGAPIVSLFSHRPQTLWPSVGNDNEAIGRLAAEHFLERKFRNFAYCGYPENIWARARESGFVSALKPAGFEPEIFHSEWPDRIPEWNLLQTRMAAWLSDLPKPTGLMACSDHFAQLVLAACQFADIAVPEEIAIIGVDNDDSVRLASPPLTSVMDNPRRVGFLGAQMLHDLMRGKPMPPEASPVLVPPIGIAARRSTDITAIDDSLVAKVTRYIRERAGEGLSVEELPGKFGVSRSVLFRRFQEALGRSPHQEIQRIHMDRVKSLLEQTDLSLESIAGMTGFEHPEYLSVAFKRATGLTPGTYRSQFQTSSAESGQRSTPTKSAAAGGGPDRAPKPQKKTARGATSSPSA